MKKITAQEFYALIERAINENTRGDYWKIKVVEETRWEEVVDEAAFDNSSFAGYGAGSTPMTMKSVIEAVDKSVIDVADLLKANGYLPQIFPLISNEERFDTSGCTDQFQSQTFSDELMKDLIWTLANHKISEKNFDKVLPLLTFENLNLLYESDIPEHQKNTIYRFNNSCDPKRKLCEEIKSLFFKADSKKDAKNASVDKFSESKEGYDEIENFLEENQEQLDENYHQFTVQLEQNRLDLAKRVAHAKEYALAEAIYTQILEKTTTTEVEGICYLNLAIAAYHQAQDYDTAISHIEKYKTILGKANSSYWMYKALIRIAQKEMKYACVNLLNLTAGKSEHDRKSWRTQILGHLTEDSLNAILDKLLALAKNTSDKNHSTYQTEYRAYLQIAVEKNNRVAQYRLYVLLRESDPFLAEMWLERSAKQGYLPAQDLLLQFYNDKYLNEEDKTSETSVHSYEQMRTLVKQSNDETAKNVMRDYYQLLADSYSSAEPKKTKDQKRKAFSEAVEANASTPPEPPFKAPRHTPSDLELHLDSHKPAKRVRIPDTTHQMVRPVKAAYQQDKSKNKRNYLAANLSLIFSDPGKTERYVRTVAIIGNDNQTTINLEDLYPTKSAEESERVTTRLNEQHKSIMARSHAIYRNAKRHTLPEAQQLHFIEETFKKHHNPHSHKHNEFVLYEYLCRKTNLYRQLNKFINENKDVFKPGCKVYGAVLDIVTANASCTDCKKLALTMQNDRMFAKALEDVLTDKGFKCLNKRRTGLFEEGNKLHIQIRIRALKQLKNKSDTYADIDVIPAEKELKTLNGACFFHKIEDLEKSGSSQEKQYLIFESGTHAPRPQAGPT